MTEVRNSTIKLSVAHGWTFYFFFFVCVDCEIVLKSEFVLHLYKYRPITCLHHNNNNNNINNNKNNCFWEERGLLLKWCTLRFVGPLRTVVAMLLRIVTYSISLKFVWMSVSHRKTKFHTPNSSCPLGEWKCSYGCHVVRKFYCKIMNDVCRATDA